MSLEIGINKLLPAICWKVLLQNAIYVVNYVCAHISKYVVESQIKTLRNFVQPNSKKKKWIIISIEKSGSRI